MPLSLLSSLSSPARRLAAMALLPLAGGAVLVAASSGGVECVEYAPARVKQAVCGHGRAEKQQVQRMVKTILALDDLPRPNHAADALAVAICHALAPPLLRYVS